MEYYKDYCEYGYGFKKLNRTGLCKVVTTDGEDREYVEHKGWFFKSWIRTTEIVVQTTDIYDCENGNAKR